MIFITGDTHGSNDVRKLHSRQWKEGKSLTKSDYLIILGDFGFIWKDEPDKTEKYYMRFFQQKKWTTLFVDGNHENFNRLDALEEVDMFNGKVGKVSDSVYHLKRGEIYTIEGKTFFVMGGAYSIDKESRENEISWWRREEPSYMEFDRGIGNLESVGFNVDYVLAHNGPSHVTNIYLRQLGMSSMVDLCGKIDTVAAYFNTLIEDYKLQFKGFYFGHWHDEWYYADKYFMMYDEIKELV